jgi:hypothetical protein
MDHVTQKYFERILCQYRAKQRNQSSERLRAIDVHVRIHARAYFLNLSLNPRPDKAIDMCVLNNHGIHLNQKKITEISDWLAAHDRDPFRRREKFPSESPMNS